MRSRTSIVRATPTMPMTRNTAFAITAAADARRRARPPRASPPAPLRARSFPARIRGALVQMGPHKIDRTLWDWDEVGRNPFFCPDPDAAARFVDYLDEIRKAGSSIGAVVEIVAEGVPAGWGAPVYGKLDAELASALMSVNAVKGVEIGDGFAAAELSGEENADEMRRGPDGRPSFLSNHSGGISAASRPVSRSSPGLRSNRHRRSSPRVAQSPAPSRRPRSSPRAATTLASASARFRSARRWPPASWRTRSCGTGGRRAGKGLSQTLHAPVVSCAENERRRVQ